MRVIPIDTSRLVLVATGHVSSKAEYVQLSDGSRKASGNQAKDPDTGMPLWVIDCLVDGETERRAEIVGVTVGSHDEPTVQKYRPIVFRGLVATIYQDGGSGRPATSLKAEGIEQPQHNVKPVPAAS